MFGMLPFERSDDNLFDTFDNFTRNFFRSSNASLPAFRTDIRDDGDKFVLEAELPGFEKEDISLDVKDGILTITAAHQEHSDQKDGKYCDWLEYCQNAKRKLWYPLVLDFWQRNNVFVAYSRMGYWRAAIA